ncbi:hypothetical protein [Streptomyces sp. NPDC055056]
MRTASVRFTGLARKTNLRRTLALYEEAIRQLALENAVLRQDATVLALPARSRSSPLSRR